MANSYSALNVTIRLFEQRLMTADDFKQLWSLTSDDAIRQKLADHHYPVSEGADFERIFDQRLNQDYDELYEMAPDARVLDLFALRFDYHNLKVLFKEQISKRDLSDLYLPYGHYDVDELRALIKGDAVEHLPAPLKQAVLDVNSAYREQHDANVISLLFDLGYLNHMKLLAHEINDSAIEEWVVRWIDLKNLVMGLRMQQEDRSRGFMFVTLSNQGSITETEWVEVLQNHDKAGLLTLTKRVTDDVQIQKVLQEDKINIAKLEHAIEMVQARLMQSAQLQAFGPLPVMSYLYFLSHEISNLRLVITAKHNDLEQSTIEERMQPIYES
ncbi:MAG: V-type ATPase subunit [Aerococcus sp.]|nr:V-type ATPase subunit [Aerococcus sp.]